MNTKLRKKAKIILKKIDEKLIKYVVFEKKKGLSILEISKIDMCESLYDMLNHNMDKKQKAL